MYLSGHFGERAVFRVQEDRIRRCNGRQHLGKPAHLLQRTDVAQIAK